jgi:hypothetical protein
MRWTPEMIAALASHARLGLSCTESAKLLGSSYDAVLSQRKRRGIDTTEEQQRHARSRGHARREPKPSPPVYACGHSRTPENTTGGDRPRCKTCKRTQTIVSWKKDTEAVDALGAEILNDVRTEFYGSCTVADLVDWLGEDHRRIRHAIRRLAERGLIQKGQSAYHRDEWVLPAKAMAA